MVQTLTYKVRLQKEPEGGFTVTVPALQGCVTYGNDIDHAIANAKEAIELYIESLAEHDEEIPPEHDILEYSITLQTEILKSP